MRLTKILITLLIFLSVSGICRGQEIIEDENWFREIAGPYSGQPYITYQYKTFTREDVARAKQKLKFIQQFLPKNEWEGLYDKNIEVGDVKLIWNLEGGFFNYYFYHQLRNVDYGKIKDSPSFIELVSEKPLISNPARKQEAQAENKLIKIKFGETHFLVPENLLQDFCDRAAGLSTDLSNFIYYWLKDEDLKKEVFALPILPEKYKHLLRYPIETAIARIGSRKIIQNKFEDGTVNYEEIHYPVTINAGKNKNIKSGMNFFAKDLGEWIQVTKILSNSSIGFIRRDFGENKQEQCRDSEDGQGEIIPCKEIKVGMKAKTKVSRNSF